VPDPANDGDKPPPAEPMTALAEGAATTHELFLAYVGAGFTPTQALYLTAEIITAPYRGGPK